jgi:hypothetical protein
MALDLDTFDGHEPGLRHAIKIVRSAAEFACWMIFVMNATWMETTDGRAVSLLVRLFTVFLLSWISTRNTGLHAGNAPRW